MTQILGVAEAVLYVQELARARQFYVDVLDLPVTARGDEATWRWLFRRRKWQPGGSGCWPMTSKLNMNRIGHWAHIRYTSATRMKTVWS